MNRSDAEAAEQGPGIGRQAVSSRRDTPFCSAASASLRSILLLVAIALPACASNQTLVVDLEAALDPNLEGEVATRIELDGARDVRILVGERPVVLEAWIEGAAFDDAAAWRAPRTVDGDIDLVVTGSGTRTLTVWARGTPPPPALRDRALAWFDPAVLDDPAAISLARVLAAISEDGHGGVLLDRWFRAFAAGPGAGRATFAQFLAEVTAAQGADPRAWDLARLPFRVTGVHNRVDLARGEDCGELRVSIASAHATFSPVHLIFLFRQDPAADDVTPDGVVHCRGAARRWARLGAFAPAAFAVEARRVLAEAVTRQRFVLAESVELSLSPWQWRQWAPDGNGGLVNPRLFQTIDVTRVNTPGPVRDAFLAEVTAEVDAIAARRWTVPEAFRAQVAEVQPNAKAALVDLAPLADALARHPELPRAIGMIGCPRCHTDDADFVQTGIDRRPSPFYDRELDARALRLDAVNAGEEPASPRFGPLQPL